jgi:hypothetical protein
VPFAHDGEELERNLALQVCIFGQVDGAHTAGTDAADDPVVRDVGANHGAEITTSRTKDAESTSAVLPAALVLLADRLIRYWSAARSAAAALIRVARRAGR